MSTISPAATPANTDRRSARKAANPQAMAPRRMLSGTLASVPGGSRMSLAITPASTAIATARAQTKNSESSSIPRTTRRPSMRQNSLGRQPTRRRRAMARGAGCGRGEGAHRRGGRGSWPRPAPAADTVGPRSRHDSGPEQIEPGLPGGEHRPEHDAEHQRQPIRDETAVARGRDQERHGREEEQAPGHYRRNRAGEIEPENGAAMRGKKKSNPKPVAEGKANAPR